MRFRWKTWSGLCATAVGLMALLVFGPAQAMAATHDVATLTELSTALASANAGDTIRLIGDIPLSSGYEFAIDTRGLTVDTNGHHLSLASGTAPTQTGTATLTFKDSVSPNTRENLAFAGFSAVEGTITLQAGTNGERTITATSDTTNVGNAGSLAVSEKGTVWNNLGDVNAGKAAGTTGSVKVLGESGSGKGVGMVADTVSIGESGTGSLDVEYGTAEVERVELGTAGGTGSINVKNAGTLVFRRGTTENDPGSITFTDANGNNGLTIGTLAIGSTGGANIAVDNGVLLVEKGEGTGGVFQWNTQTTQISVTNGGFLNFQNGLTADFTGTSLQNGIAMDNASFIWVGTQSTPNVVGIPAETKFTTSTASTFDMKNGSTFYSTDTMTFTAGTGGSFTINVDGKSSDNVSAYFGTFGDMNLTGDGDFTINSSNSGSFSAGKDLIIDTTGKVRISATDGGSVSVGKNLTINDADSVRFKVTDGSGIHMGESWTMTLKGSALDDPEILIDGLGSYIAVATYDSNNKPIAGEIDFTVAGNAFLTISDVGGLEAGLDATFTTEAAGTLNLSISGTQVVDGKTYSSYLSVGNNLTISGDGNAFIKLEDGGQLHVGNEFNLDLVGSNADNPEVLIRGENSLASIGKAKITTTGASFIDITDLGTFYSDEANFTANGAGSSFTFNISGSKTVGDTTTASAFESYGATTLGGDGDFIFNLDDAGYLRVGGSGGNDPAANLVLGSTGQTTFNIGEDSALVVTGKTTTASDGSLVLNVNEKGYAGFGGNLEITNAETDIVVAGKGATMQVNGKLSMGTTGEGRLEVSGGGYLETGSAILGATAGGYTVVNVHGNDDSSNEYSSAWYNTGDLVVGDVSNAELNIFDTGLVGYDSENDGALNLIVGKTNTADNSVINLSKSDADEWSALAFATATIGQAGSGTLNINAWGEASGGKITVGSDVGATGTVNISGEKAQLLISEAAIIGSNGTGIVNVNGKGRMEAAAITLGQGNSSSGGNGTLTVTDKGTVVGTGLMTVGSSGSGTVNLSGGGKITVAGVNVGENKKSLDNIINISGSGTEFILTAAAAKDPIPLGAGSGTLSVSDQAKMTIKAGSYFAMNGDATFGNGAELRLETTPATSSANAVYSRMYLGDENTLTFTHNAKLTGNGLIWMRSAEDGDAGSVVIKSGGILSPGHDGTKNESDKYGYMYIDGNLSITGGGIYEVNLGGAGGCDQIEVSGFTNLEGGVIRVSALENFTDNTEWVILASYANEDDTKEGITGSWSIDSGGMPSFVSIKEKVNDGIGNTEDNTYLTLMVDRVAFFNGKGSNANSRAVGGALDKVPLSQWYKELEMLAGGTDAEINDAMRQMSGSIHGNAMFLARQQLWYPIADRVSWTPDGRAYLGPQHPYHVGLRNRSTVWLNTNYNYTKVDGSHGLDGFRVDTFNILVGLDTIFEENFAGGVYAGFSAPRLKQDGDRAEADNFTAGIHAAYKFMGGFEVKGMLAYTYHTFYTDRYMDFFNGDHHHANAKYNGSSLTASVEFAMPVYFGCVVLRPLFAIDMEYVWMEDVIESGAGLYNLKFNKSNSAWTFARLGANFDITPWQRFNLKGRLFYTVQMDDPDTSFSASFTNSSVGMRVQGTDPGRHFFNAGVTAHYTLGQQQRASLYANYDMYVGNHSNSHMVGFGFQFLY